MIKLKQINEEVVKPIPIICPKEEEIKGFCLFPNVYANIFLVARKKSGKTSTIFKIVKECVGKKTKVFMFASTIFKDPNLIHIYHYLKKKKISIQKFTSLSDNLEEILKGMQIQDKDSDEEEKKPKIKFITFNEEKEAKERKEKKVYPENIFIMDDLGEELRSKTINTLLKTNRHYKSKVILSSQYLHDLMPEARKQLDYVLIFGGMTEAKLETLYKDMDLSIPFDTFLSLYYHATTEKYNFLYVDTQDNRFRKNFSIEYLIEQ